MQALALASTWWRKDCRPATHHATHCRCLLAQMLPERSRFQALQALAMIVYVICMLTNISSDLRAQVVNSARTLIEPEPAKSITMCSKDSRCGDGRASAKQSRKFPRLKYRSRSFKAPEANRPSPSTPCLGTVTCSRL